MPDPALTQAFWQQFWMAVVSGVFTAVPLLVSVALAYLALRTKMLDMQTKSEARNELQIAKMETVVAKVDQVKELANGLSSKLVEAVDEKATLRGVLEEKNRAETELAMMAKGAVEERERNEFRKELIVEANGTKEARVQKQEASGKLDVAEINVDTMNVEKKKP